MKYDITIPDRLVTALVNLNAGDVFQFADREGTEVFGDAMFIVCGGTPAEFIVNLRNGTMYRLSGTQPAYNVVEFDCLGFKERTKPVFDISSDYDTKVCHIKLPRRAKTKADDKPTAKEEAATIDNKFPKLFQLLLTASASPARQQLEYFALDHNGNLHGFSSAPTYDSLFGKWKAETATLISRNQVQADGYACAYLYRPADDVDGDLQAKLVLEDDE